MIVFRWWHRGRHHGQRTACGAERGPPSSTDLSRSRTHGGVQVAWKGLPQSRCVCGMFRCLGWQIAAQQPGWWCPCNAIHLSSGNGMLAEHAHSYNAACVHARRCTPGPQPRGVFTDTDACRRLHTPPTPQTTGSWLTERLLAELALSCLWQACLGGRGAAVATGHSLGHWLLGRRTAPMACKLPRPSASSHDPAPLACPCTTC